MYICPECGEKLDKNATICPCCGRGNRDNHNNKYDFILIVFGLIILSIGIITTVSFAYSEKETKYDESQLVDVQVTETASITPNIEEEEKPTPTPNQKPNQKPQEESYTQQDLGF